MGHPAMVWQQKPVRKKIRNSSGRHWLHAATLYNIAAYPHLKGDDLAEQAQALSNRAYEEAAQRLPGTMRQMEFTVPGGAPITGFLHMPKGDGPFPTVLMCGWSGCDADGLLQPCMNVILRRAAFAMLTIDMPSVGFFFKMEAHPGTPACCISTS